MDHIADVFTCYRAGAYLDSPPHTLSQHTRDQADNLKKNLTPSTPGIRCIGVWDTVGSLGIPDVYVGGVKIPLDTLFGDPNKNYRFHNTNLHSTVNHAFQAYVSERAA
jgi:hypothetical protein